MRIGIDCRTILNPGHGEGAGIGHYTYHLVKNLLKLDWDNEYVFFFDDKMDDTREFKREKTKIIHFPFIQYKKFMPIAYSHFLASAFLNREKLDVFHSPASVIPLSYRRPSVVTIHDMAIYYRREWFPKGQKFSTKIAVPKTLEKVKKIIAVSQSTKNDIVKIFKIDPNKIKVIYNGVDRRVLKDKGEKRDVRSKFGIKKRYILYVGSIEPRKNILGLIRAFSKIQKLDKFKDFQLVIAGKKAWLFEDVEKLVKKLKLGDKIIFTGYVSWEDKINLIRKALCFVFPSFYEGFGLSILEALYYRTPVITSKISSLPEVAGDAAEYIDPYNLDSLVSAMKKVLGSRKLRDEMRAKGTEQVNKFSWRKCAEETLAVYKEVVS